MDTPLILPPEPHFDYLIVAAFIQHFRRPGLPGADISGGLPAQEALMETTQAQKRQRATTFPSATGAAPACGLLEVHWDSPFDRLCFQVSAPDLAIKNNRRYTALMAELIAGSGCTEEEILAHGNKVRAYLFFAQDRLKKEGQLEGLTGKEKRPYRLAPVNPAF